MSRATRLNTGVRQTDATALVRTNRIAGNRIVAMGDSITFNNNGGHFKQNCQRTNQRALFSGWYATQGYTIEQIQATHLPSVLALTGNQKPAACMILAGTNNCGADSGSGPGSGFNFTQAKSTYLAVIKSLQNAGIMPVVCTVPPRTDATLSNTNVRQWNAWLVGMAARAGLPVIDYHSALVSTGGSYNNGLSADNIHPNMAGYRVMTAATYSTLASLFPPGGPYLSRSNYDPQNLIPGLAQIFAGTVTSGLAQGWANYSSGTGQTFTVEAPSDSVAGFLQTLTKPQAATGNAYLQLNPGATSGFAVGDRLAFACAFQALNFEAQAGNQNANITVDFRNSSGTVIGTSMQPLYASVSDFTTTCIAYDEGVVPTGTTSVTVGLALNGTASTTGGATLKVGQPTLVNLTALGLA